jgi:pyridoxal phosphate enzyme (YggS family)
MSGTKAQILRQAQNERNEELIMTDGEGLAKTMVDFTLTLTLSRSPYPSGSKSSLDACPPFRREGEGNRKEALRRVRIGAVDIEANIREVQRRMARACERSRRSPDEITLVAVTKGADVSTIRAAFQYGIRDLGENRVQEAEGKIAQLADLKPDVTWHMVGHLQSNKTKSAVELFDIIHSVDSIKLAEVLSRRVEKPLPVLLEVNVSGEATKGGFSVGETEAAVKEIGRLPNLKLMGLMTVAPVTAEPEAVRPVFRKLRELRDSLGLKHLSMGMTDDFEVAVEEGATMLRIGRAIFGDRRQ